MCDCKCKCATRPNLHPDFSEQLRKANEQLAAQVEQLRRMGELMGDAASSADRKRGA